MISNSETKSPWQELHDRGVNLKDRDINFVTNTVVDGISAALNFLKIETDKGPNIIFSDNLDRIGYSLDKKSINIPIKYLNQLAEINQPLSDQQASYSVDKKTVTFSYSTYLKRVGMEETIHHFQNIGHPTLTATYSDKDPNSLTENDKLLCDIEVEARTIVDKIAISLGEKAIWSELDNYLKQKYPKKYGKTVDFLIK